MKNKHVRRCLVSLVITLTLFFPLIIYAEPLDNWHLRSTQSAGNYFLGICYGNGMFVTAGGQGAIAISNNGTNWTTATLGSTLSFNGVAYGKGVFVAVGKDGVIFSSANGEAWTQMSSGTTLDLYGITYGNSKFVAVGAGAMILTSTDGISWSKKSTSSYDPLESVTYDNNIFIAVGGYGTVVLSDNGDTWTSGSAGSFSNTNYGIAFGNGTFVAVGRYGTILISTDGKAWEMATSGTSNDLYAITYRNGIFVAAGGNSTILTSKDGTLWTIRPVTAVFKQLDGIAFGNSTFVAVGDGGTILQSDPVEISATTPLSSGWNFISFPKLPAHSTPIETVLKDVSSNIRIVWGYDNQSKAWKKFKPGISNDTLTTIETGKGYWVYANLPGDIDMTGWTYSANTVRLYEGWNLVGYSGAQDKDVAESLSSIDNNWNVIWNWTDNQWYGKYATITSLPLPIQPLTNLKQGKAYWIKIEQGMETDWTQ